METIQLYETLPNGLVVPVLLADKNRPKQSNLNQEANCK